MKPYVISSSNVKRMLWKRNRSKDPKLIAGIEFRTYEKFREDREVPRPSPFGSEYVDIAGFNLPRWVLTKAGREKLERNSHHGQLQN